MTQLTKGSCLQIFSADEAPEGLFPVMQILNVKKINAATNAAAADRYRLIVSDGEHYGQAMLATQLNHLVTDKEIDKNTLAKLTSFVVNSVQGRKLIIVLQLEPIPYSGDKIGNPQNVDQTIGTGGPAAPAAAAGGPGPGPAANGRPKQENGGRSGPPKVTGRGGKDMGPIYPIEGLSPYQNKWTIKARVTQKSDIKHWTNQRGEGKLFSVTFMDESGEIKATGFNEQVDTLYPLLEEGKVYFVTKARVNLAKKQFSNINNDYEITFDRETDVEPCEDASVPQVKYNFKGIDALGELNKDDLCDVLGIVREVGELSSITSKASNKPFAKRDIQLVDQSGQSVRLTLWGKQAESFTHDDAPVIAFKGVKVGDFGGRSLSMFSSATMSVNPEINEAHALRGWYDSNGRNANFTAYTSSTVTRSDAAPTRMSEIKTIGEAKDENLGMRDKVDYFSTSAVIAFIKSESFAYPACANPDGCNKKVIEGSDGWHCDKCDKAWPEPIYRYILNMNCMDHTSSFWITAFNEVAEKILGITANELNSLKSDGEDNAFAAKFNSACGKTYSFDMMAKQDSYNVRVRYTCRKANVPDYATESQWLSQQIAQFSI